MKKIPFWIFALSCLLSFGSMAQGAGQYRMVVEGFDWGPAVSKVILHLDQEQSTAAASDFVVYAKRQSTQFEVPAEQRAGQRQVLFAYVSDAEGNPQKTGKYLSLDLLVGPNHSIGSPFQYTRANNRGGNYWVDYSLSILNQKTHQVWNQSLGKKMPLIDEFDLKGSFTAANGMTLAYASYFPKIQSNKIPLIIWLHGGGEGGNDPTIPLLGNRAANYASADIQQIFSGAAVLVPQCPGAWMHNAQKVTTHGKEDDVYNAPLLALIDDFLKNHPEIDANRIYVGGCSNGGYMALKLILLRPNFFAAGYISALAYQSQYITDAEIQSIKNVPIWFVHSKDDQTTLANLTVEPVYQRLKAAAAPQVYMTLYDHVVDITGLYGGKQHLYAGHWSWVYLHANLPQTDADGRVVKYQGVPVKVMEWMSMQNLSQRNTNKAANRKGNARSH